MNINTCRTIWQQEEQYPFKGWDFSHIDDRMREEPLPWSYRHMVLAHMSREKIMLDMGTGGGEFLLSLRPTAGKTFATESYLPNISLSRNVLRPHGIVVEAVQDDGYLPFADNTFDLVINRHESFRWTEVYRVLKPGGCFITQQVGGSNNRDLSKFLLGTAASHVDFDFYLAPVSAQATDVGFTIMEQEEYFPKATFYDVGALIYFAKIIEWEFPNFSVEKCFDRLLQLQQVLETQGYIESTEHRFVLVAKK